MADDENRQFVTALARGLDVLRAFRSRDRLLGNVEIARRTGLPKSTVSRLTYTLTKIGYLEAAEDGTGHAGYRLGAGVLALSSAMMARMDLRALARPLMQDLADQSQAMVSLGMREGLSMIYVENCRSLETLTLSLDVGSRIPLATTAMGRAYLAACASDERRRLVEQMAQRAADPESVTQGVQRACEEYERTGCCLSIGEWQADVHAIAVAVRPQFGRSLMAINCGGPASHLSRDYLLDEVRPLLLRMVERLVRTGALSG
jgi:DNA-binding IclR family transcriptional regulator